MSRKRPIRRMKAHRLDRKKVTQTSATEIASALCDDMGIKASKVRFEEPKIGIAGYYLHSDQTISLCGQRNQNISVLLHELAHHLHLNTSPAEAHGNRAFTRLRFLPALGQSNRRLGQQRAFARRLPGHTRREPASRHSPDGGPHNSLQPRPVPSGPQARMEKQSAMPILKPQDFAERKEQITP